MGAMAVAIKFRAPYIFHRDGALPVRAWSRLVTDYCVSLFQTQEVCLKRNGMNVVLVFLILKSKMFRFKN